jgi:hypothetical protein
VIRFENEARRVHKNLSGLSGKEMSLPLTGIELTSLSLHVVTEQPRYLITGSTVTKLRPGLDSLYGQTLGHSSILANRHSAKYRRVKVDGT